MTTERTFNVEGMSCGGCEASIRNGVGTLPGVKSVDASHTDKRVRVDFEPDTVDERAITDKIEQLGFRVVAG